MRSAQYQAAKVFADSLNVVTRAVMQAVSSTVHHIEEWGIRLENKTHAWAITADQRAVQIAEDAHDKLIAVHHSAMKEANVLYEAAQREAATIIRKAKAEREMMVNLAADGCDEVRQALRKARDWHDA